MVAPWAEFANADPELAAFGRERIEGRIVYHATLRTDGSPRVHPVSPWFATGLMMVSFRARSPKVDEIARDGRYAMHSVLPATDHDGDAGEFMVRGWMERVGLDHPAAIDHRLSFELAYFACGIEEAVGTTYPEDAPVYRRWRAGG